MHDEIKQDYEFNLAVAFSLNRIMKCFRWKMDQGGYDLSVENMADLRKGIEGELIDFASQVQHPATST